MRCCWVEKLAADSKTAEVVVSDDFQDASFSKSRRVKTHLWEHAPLSEIAVGKGNKPNNESIYPYAYHALNQDSINLGFKN